MFTSGTDVAEAIQDGKPIYGATETRNPANQWLANHRARRALAVEVHNAGIWATYYVRGGLWQYEGMGDAKAYWRTLGSLAKAAFRKGWMDHHDLDWGTL